MLTLNELNELMSDIEGWSFESDAIVKIFSFDKFEDAKGFVDKVGEIAEGVEHYPDLMWNNDKVRISLTTPSERGLTKKDFEVAREIDRLISDPLI